jgi:N-acetylneuraminate synthase
MTNILSIRIRPLVIEGIEISDKQPPFVIAEMSANHNQSLDRAFEIVDEAARIGVHAVKIQTYTADTMTLDLKDNEFLVSDENSLWKGKTLYDLYREASTPWKWHRAIFDRCKKRGLIGFSTPFDSTAVDFLESLNVPCYKIASFENTHIPLIKKVASTGKPFFMSTGMATYEELKDSIEVIRQSGNPNFILMKCTSSYPALPEDANLTTIPDLKARFRCHVGVSDHTMGIGVSVAASALGAVAIEKHFILSRNEEGVDSSFSMEPAEMKLLVEESKKAWQSLGQVVYGPTEKEKKSLQFRRSLYIVKDLRTGDVLNVNNVRAIRPGLGLPPKYFELVLGKKIKRNACRGTPLNWDMIDC